MTIEELFGTLQMSVVAGWRKHLKSAKYGKHVALQEFYEEMPDKVDALIEAWMGAHGKKVGSFQNILSSSNMNTLKYLQELKKICKEGYELMGDNDELKGLMDDIVNQINSTLYKVKELSESSMMDLSDFVNEALNEGRNEYPYDEKHFNAKDCLTWLLKTKVLKHYNRNIDADEWAEMAQAAAEDAGLPLYAAEQVYDAAYGVAEH
jgi:DNA-binding ferritin-like protein